MQLQNPELQNFVSRIKLQTDDMSKYRSQVNNLKEKLSDKIKNDNRTGLKVTKFLLTGSWKKRTILRATGANPIDIDLVLFVEGDENLMKDLKQLHDFVVGYLEEIYPSKDISRDVDAEGKTKSIKIRFSGTGLELDIVPVIPLSNPVDYVWQPQRGGGNGKKYTTSITKQLEFAKQCKDRNPSYTGIVRCLKWWRNFKELHPTDDEAGLSSFAVELIIAYLDINKGVESNLERGIIRFFDFLSTSGFPIIKFSGAINSVLTFNTPVFIADPTNNENNAAKKLDDEVWKEIVNEANEAFETLCIAQSKGTISETISEWKSVFGPSFNITEK
jgi:hypothetical protein